METPYLKSQAFEVEVELECVKTRMELIKREEVESAAGEVTDQALEVKEREDKISREVFDTESGTLSMCKERVTDAKYNARSFPPRMASIGDELQIQLCRKEIMNSFAQVRREICDKTGKQQNSNLSDFQQEGKDSLQEKVRSGEIVVTLTDKSGKLAVVEPDLYRRAASVHIKDREVPWQEVSEVETLLNRHSMQLIKALSMGTKHGKNGQVDRVRKAYTSKDAKPGPIYFLVKDHKAVKPGESIPPTRPVCSAKGGPGSRLSNLASTLINKTADSIDSETECMSTEEMLQKILQTNREIRRRSDADPVFRERVKELVVLSMDVCALYPSLRIEEVVKILYEMILKAQEEGKLKLEDVNWLEVGKYLAITCSKEELVKCKIVSAVPKRSVGEDAPGRKPGPAYWESDTIKVAGEIMDKWIKPKQPSDHQKRRMFALMVCQAVKTSMSNHLYRFDGKVFKQEDGGPIGDELSQAVARLVMIWWDQKFLSLCQTTSLEMLFYARYVDDTNKAIVPPPLGTRFEDGALVTKPECVEEDRGRERDKVVGELLRSMANSITPMFKFEEDVCSNHADKKLPILDLKVWSEAQECAVIKHTFYKKSMATQGTLRANTAYPTSQIRAIMVEEVLRRLRNCSPECTWEERGEHLTNFALSLKSSGHQEHFRQLVFEKAVARFEKELLNHNQGTADLYRSRKERQRQTKAKGGKATKDSWFRLKKEADEERVTSVLSVPYTSGAKLLEKVRAVLDDCKSPAGIKIKAQEGGGSKLQHTLMRPDPFPRKKCHREDCPVILRDGECGETCFQNHVNYVITCVRCDEARRVAKELQDSSGASDQPSPPLPPEFVYVGESSRGCYIRFKQHVEKYKKRDNFMWQHVRDCHDGVIGEDPHADFSVRRVSIDADPMRRVLRESVHITKLREAEDSRKSGELIVMNTKDEFFGVKVVQPRFVQE